MYTHDYIYIYVYICTMIVEYCAIYLFMYNICNIWIKYKWTWGCNSSERSGIQWHFTVRYSDAGKRQEWGSSATIRDYNDWALAASSKNAVTRFIGFLYKQNHQMHMIWGYLSRFFGHRDSSLLRQARHLGAHIFHLHSDSGMLSGLYSVRQRQICAVNGLLPRCPDVQMSIKNGLPMVGSGDCFSSSTSCGLATILSAREPSNKFNEWKVLSWKHVGNAWECQSTYSTILY